MSDQSIPTDLTDSFGQWVDADLGCSGDYVGCDVSRGLGLPQCRWCNNDGCNGALQHGIPPAVGVDFFEGPYQDARYRNAIGIGFNEAVREMVLVMERCR